MKDTDFITASSYIRTLENRLLKKSKLENLVSLDSIPDILKGLSQGTDYQFTSVQNLEEAEQILKDEWKRVCGLVHSISPHEEVIRIVLCPYEFHTLRIALKTNQVKSEQVKKLSDELKEILFVTLERKEEDIQKKEVYLDKKMYETMLDLSKRINSEILSEQVRMKIDFYNIKVMLRAREMRKEVSFFEQCFAEGGTLSKDIFMKNYSVPVSAIGAAFTYKYCSEEMQKGLEAYEVHHNFSELEVLMNNILIHHLKKAKFVSYGAEVIYAYLIAKEMEIRQIRLLLTCKSKHISNAILSRKLGESYA